MTYLSASLCLESSKIWISIPGNEGSFIRFKSDGYCEFFKTLSTISYEALNRVQRLSGDAPSIGHIQKEGIKHARSCNYCSNLIFLVSKVLNFSHSNQKWKFRFTALEESETFGDSRTIKTGFIISQKLNVLAGGYEEAFKDQNLQYCEACLLEPTCLRWTFICWFRLELEQNFLGHWVHSKGFSPE